MSDSSPFPTNATQLDPDNPWPGLDSFEENARDYFHGRVAEAEELLRRVVDAPLTVLFGKSGLGKTSLLRAGLFPRLREKHFLPVHLRLDIRPEAPSLIEQLRDALRAAIERDRVDAPTFAEGETLWEYLHRSELEFWSGQNYPLIPVLVLDQFEEVFTLGERLPGKVERFQVDFGDLAENRIPMALATRLANDAATARRLDLRAMPYKLIVTLREDFLPHLEGWRRAVPSLGRVRVRLLPMRRDQALSVVYETAPHLMDEPLAQRIVEFVAAAQTAETAPHADGASLQPSNGGGPGGEIEPALLSLFCRGLNERRKRQGKDRFDEQLLEGAQESIIADYFYSCVEGLPDGVSRFIETELVTGKGFRNSYAKDDAVPHYLTQEQLDRLINRRLLRLEERYGTVRIELTHDLLTRAVMDQRDRRRIEEEKAAFARRAEEERQTLEAQTRKQRQRLRAMALVALICLALAGIAGWQWWKAVVAEQAAQEAKGEALRAKELADNKTTEANAQKLVADDAKVRANMQAELARKREEEALEARQVAEHQARVAYARELAATALPMVKASDQDERAVLIGMYAVAATYSAERMATREAEDVLRRAVGGSVTELAFPGHQGEVRAIGFSPDGTELATCADDRTVRVWNAASSEELRRAEVGGCDELAFGPDGIRLATGRGLGIPTVVRDLLSNHTLLEIERSRGQQIERISLSADGRRLAATDIAGWLTIWAVATKEELMRTPVGRSSPIALNADGTRVAAVLKDGAVEVRDVKSNSQLRPFPPEGQVAIALSPDGRLLAIAGRNNELVIWNVDTGERSPPLAAGPVDALAFSAPAGRYLATAIKDNGVTVWDTASNTQVQSPRGLSPMAFTPGGARLATASAKTSAVVWDVKSGNRLATLFGRIESDIQAVALSSDTRRVATASRDGKLRVWDAASGRPVRTLASGGSIELVALSPSGGHVSVWGKPAGLRVWDLSSDGAARQIPLRADRLLDMAFTDNGARLLTAAYQGKRALELWDTASASPVPVPYTASEDRRAMFAVAFSRDERRIAAANTEGAIVREVASSRGDLLQIRGHWYDLVFGGQSGRWLAVSDPNRTEVWDVDARRRVSRAPIAGAAQLKALGRRLALREDGRLVATVDRDRRTATVWDAATGAKQTTFYRHAGDIRAIAFTPDGTRVAVVVDDWTVHYHPVGIPDLMSLARTRVKRLMTSEDCQKYLGRPQCPALAG